MEYPKYYRKDASCIMRVSDLKGTEVKIPATAEDKLPLVMHVILYPNKERFDEAVKGMEEVDEQMFDEYMLRFTGAVDMYIKDPMTERAIQRELSSQVNFKRTGPPPPDATPKSQIRTGSVSR